MAEDERGREQELEEPRRVEETRKGVAKMAVEEERRSNTASKLFGSMTGRAKEGWSKVKKLMEGKRVTGAENGGIVIVGEGDESDQAKLDRREEWDEKVMGGTVEIEEVESETGDDEEKRTDGSLGSGETWRGSSAFEFLDRVEVEERDEELDNKLGEGRKRKRESDRNDGKKGLKGLPGWERKSAEVKKLNRWKRKVVRWVEADKESQERKETIETIPLPESFDLGNETKGTEMNNSGRLKNNFGMNKEAPFSGGQGMKNETRNWICSFTKTGCVSCRDDDGRLNHRGRDGLPVTLIVGDESVPNVVGYTGKNKEGGTGDSCVWIMKVEHLGLDEVGGVLRKMNLDKRAADRANGKREHEFFNPNGS